MSAESGDAYRYLLLLILVTVVLSVVASVAAGDHSIPHFGSVRLGVILSMTLLYATVFAFVVFVRSLVDIRSFVDESTGSVDLRAIGRVHGVAIVPAVLAFATTIYGITSAGNLAELYRVQGPEVVWHDDFLWLAEAPYLSQVINFSNPPHLIWDYVYLAFWGVIAFTSAVLIGAREHRIHANFAIAIVLSYFLTRSIAIWFPTAGPLFHQPDLFQISGTASGLARDLLVRYMAGEVPQDGFLPGTMAMPSLHVGSTALAALALASRWQRSLVLMAPVTLLVWMSTVVLGWHYILDGIGGIAVAALSYRLASALTGLVTPEPSVRITRNTA